MLLVFGELTHGLLNKYLSRGPWLTDTAQIGWFGLRVGGHPALSLHSSNEPGELSQWLCHDDSTINIVSNIIIIIIIIIIIGLRALCETLKYTVYTGLNGDMQ